MSSTKINLSDLSKTNLNSGDSLGEDAVDVVRSLVEKKQYAAAYEFTSKFLDPESKEYFFISQAALVIAGIGNSHAYAL